jgi:pimeloyl-ACP methyl ester carboxylesterase
MAYLGQYYRTYALDFWGFGESGKKMPTFAVNDFVSMVDQFMDRLGIIQAPLVGHSMGGTVSLLVAIRYPHRVSKVVVVGSPIVGSSLAFLLKLAGYRINARLVFNAMWALRLGLRLTGPIISKDPQFYNMMVRDLSRTTLESFLLSIASLRKTDLRSDLNQISVPALGMYGDRDIIVNPNQWQPMQSGIPDIQIERFKNAGHFIMLDEAPRFMETLKNFLDDGSGPEMEDSPLEHFVDNAREDSPLGRQVIQE